MPESRMSLCHHLLIMLATKIVSVLIIISTCLYQFHAVAKDTDMILILDFTDGFNTADLDSVLTLTAQLFIRFDSNGAVLRLCPLVANDVEYTMPTYTAKWFVGTSWWQVPSYLREKLKQRSKWGTKFETSNLDVQLFPTALSGSAKIFEQDRNSGATKVVVMVTNRHEFCIVNECLDAQSCCYNCQSCYMSRGESCKLILTRWVDQIDINVDTFVTSEPNNLKKQGVTVITVGVGNKINATRLRCWASGDHMFILYPNYMPLGLKGAIEVVGLLLGGSTHTNAPLVRSTTTTNLPTTTKSKSSTETSVPPVRSSPTTTLSTTTKAKSSAHTSVPPVRSSPATTLPIATKSKSSAHTSVPFVRSGPITPLPIATKSKSSAHTSVPLVRSSTTATIPTTAITATTTFSSAKTNAVVTGAHTSNQNTQSVSHLATGKSTSASWRWYWWLLVAIAIIVAALVLLLALLGAGIWRWKRKKRSLIPVVAAGNVGSSTGQPQLYTSGDSYKPISSFVQNQSSYLLKKPYLEPDLYSATTVQRSKRSGYGLVKTKQQLLGPPIKAAFKAQFDGAVPNIKHKGKWKSPPNKYIKPITYHFDKGARAARNIKGVVSTGIPRHKRPWQGGNITKRSARMYDKFAPEATGRVLPISYMKDTKAFKASGGPTGCH